MSTIRSRRLPTLLAAVLGYILISSTTPRAETGVIDEVPAATLLLSYFEVDMDNPSGVTTTMSVVNTRDQPTLAHVVFWTDWAVPTLNFNLYLSGNDVVSLNVRDVFNGVVPHTEPPSTGPGSGYESCDGQLPPSPLPPNLLDHIRNVHTGKGSILFANNCAGQNFGDQNLRGYITIDVVNICSLKFPGEPGYFVDGGNGEATNENILWGEYQLIDPVNNFAQGDALVHIEADPALNTGYTFYGRLINGSAVDNRETLASKWAVPFRKIPEEFGHTDLLVWRDPKVPVNPAPCGSIPSPFPLTQQELLVFNTETDPRNAGAPSGDPPMAVSAFPFATNRVGMSGPVFSVSERSGWLRADLNTTVSGAAFNPNAQSHVTIIESSLGLFSTGARAIQLENARGPSPP